MIIETITVTTTPTTILELLNTKRGISEPFKGFSRIELEIIDVTSETIIEASQVDTVTPITILNAKRNQVNYQFEWAFINNILLATDTGTSDLKLICHGE